MMAPEPIEQFEPCADTERLFCLALVSTVPIEVTQRITSKYLELCSKADKILDTLMDMGKDGNDER